MSLGFDALSVLIILLPGFFCARIFQWLCVRPQQTEMDKVVEAQSLVSCKLVVNT
jgi:hypothetical protein